MSKIKKEGRRDLNKYISCKNVVTEMQCWNHGVCCWVRRRKALRKLETSLLARIPSIVHLDTSPVFANMNFIYRTKQGNGSHARHVPQFSTLLNDYSLRYIILLLPLQKFWANAHIMPRSIKLSTNAQPPMKTVKWSAIKGI